MANADVFRLLTLIFCTASMGLDLYYYLKVVDHPSRWVKLSYVFVSLGWIVYILSIFFLPEEKVAIMGNTAAPLISFTSMSHFGGSLLRIKDIIEGRVQKREKRRAG